MTIRPSFCNTRGQFSHNSSGEKRQPLPPQRLGVSPFCFLQPKGPFWSFFRTIRPLFATAGVALFITSARRFPVFPRPNSPFRIPHLQTGFTIRGSNFAKTQLHRARCIIPIVQTPPLQNSRPRCAEPPCFPVPNSEFRIPNCNFPPPSGGQNTPNRLLHNPRPI